MQETKNDLIERVLKLFETAKSNQQKLSCAILVKIFEEVFI